MIGTLITIDARDADPALLADYHRLRGLVADTCGEHGTEVMKSIAHYRDPHGVTVLVLLDRQSHVALHTDRATGTYTLDVLGHEAMPADPIARSIVGRIGGRVEAYDERRRPPR